MSWHNVATIAGKDLRILFTKRSVRLSIVLFPLVAAVGLPLVIRYAGSRHGGIPAAALPRVLDAFTFLDEWLLVGWQARPHDSLRDPYFPRRAISPNDKYTALVAAAGYLPLTLSGEDYLELLPVAWRQINDYGIRIDYRTYDSPELGQHRRQHSGIAARRGLWEVHYDPYDLSRVFVRTRDGWVTAEWTHLPMISAPFADFSWRHARRLAAQTGRDDTNETEVARVLDELLTRAGAGPQVGKSVDKASARIAARTRVVAATHRPPPVEESLVEPDEEDELDAPSTSPVIPMGIFDARAEAERWPY